MMVPFTMFLHCLKLVKYENKQIKALSNLNKY